MKVRVATGQCVVPGAMAGGGRENARGKNEFARYGGCLAPELGPGSALGLTLGLCVGKGRGVSLAPDLGPGSALGSTLGWNQGRV